MPTMADITKLMETFDTIKKEKTMSSLIELDKQHFAKMYPDVDCSGKYILWVGIDLWWPYIHDKVECTMKISGLTHCKLRQNDPNECPTSEIVSNQGLLTDTNNLTPRHLYPNRGYYTACMTNGRKRCDRGVVLYFDSFSELEKVKEVAIYWTVTKTIGKDLDQSYCFVTIYNLSFEMDPDKKVYTLTDTVRTIREMADADEEALEKFKQGYSHIYLKAPEAEGYAKGGLTKSVFFHGLFSGITEMPYGEVYVREKKLVPHTHYFDKVSEYLASANEKTIL